MKPILASEAIGQNGSFKEMHIAHLSHVLLDPKIPLDPKIGQTLHCVTRNTQEALRSRL